MRNADMRDFLKRSKVLLRALLGKEFLIRPDIDVETEMIGSGDCAWSIIPDEIGEDWLVYSFGVGEDVSFDLGMIDRFSVEVHAFDPTPRVVDWVARQDLPSQFNFHALGLAAYDGEAKFYPPTNPSWVSHSMLRRQSEEAKPLLLDVRRFETIVQDLDHRIPDIGKLDIEGSEYDVIDDMIESEILPRMVLVEFHHRFQDVDPSRTRNAIEKLRTKGYALFDVSPSNREFSFILKDP